MAASAPNGVSEGGPQAASTPLYRPIAVDLFAGAGGLSLGFEQAGFDVVTAVEYDPVHAATHLYNFPACEVVCRDLARLGGADLLAAVRRGLVRHGRTEQWDGVVDAVIGGPPCQGFSTGGKRDVADVRNQMILEFVRLVEEVRPRVVCMENVSGFLDGKFETVREEAFRRLRTAGYFLSGTSLALNAKEFGVPQSRRRVIVLGSLDGEVDVPVSLDAPPVSVKQALEGLPNPSHYPELLTGDACRLSPADLMLRRSVTGGYARVLSGIDVPAWDFSRSRTWDYRSISGSRRTLHSEDTVRRFSATSQGAVEPKSRLFRLAPGGQARTLRAGSGADRGAHTSPRPIHPTMNRVITVREAARLHGFPDWFRFHVTNWHGHRQIGNSVPPPLGCAVASHLLRVLGIKPSRPPEAIGLGAESLLKLSQSEAANFFGAPAEEIPLARIRQKKVDTVEVSSISAGGD